MAAPPLLLLQDIHLTFGGLPLLEGAELSVSPGERLCLVGRNGSGKSTLLKIAAGLAKADDGRRFVQPGTVIRYLAQEPDLSAYATVMDYVIAGLPPGDDPYHAGLMLEGLGLSGNESPATLSGGELRRAALAQALAPEPDILLLDEPTNHLDLPTIEWLESTLKASRSAIVLISHDRRFLEGLSRTTLWLDRGITRRLERNFVAFESWRDEFLEQEEIDRHKMDRKIAREQDWVVHGVSGRRKRNQKRLADLQALRQTRKELRHVTGVVKLTQSEANVSGKLVIEAKHISKSYGDRAIVNDLTIDVLRGDRLGIIGANGAGKTTLLKMLTGVMSPDIGKIKVGVGLKIVTLDQQRSLLDPKATLSATLTGGHGDSVIIDGKPRHVMSYMRDFLFGPEQAKTPVSALSGGERGRLMLARALSQPSNLLVLDEPTNDLDLETLDLLQEMLADYSGTVLLVSHDRDFLDRVATSVITAEGNGRWTEYAGGYSDMMAQKGPGIAGSKMANVKGAVSYAPKASSDAPRAKPAPSGAKKMTFKDKHALETLPARIASLHVEIAKLHDAMADADLFTKNPAKFQSTNTMLAAKTVELESAEHRWLELEMLREEIEG